MRGLIDALPADGTPLLLDGGLATQCEAMGADLSSDDLWSARLLEQQPALLRLAHSAFLGSGAECCITASYQCSVPNLVKTLEVSEERAKELIALSVTLAREACDAAIARGTHGDGGNLWRAPIVAASSGPYGACCADGSEYTGAYGATMSIGELTEWHRARFDVLASCPGVDVLAIETIPCAVEVQALLSLLKERPDAKAWISLACNSDSTLNSGEELADVVFDLAVGDTESQVEAIGVNCCSPRHVAPLLDVIRKVRVASRFRLIAYPNSGEAWDAEHDAWVEGPSDELDLTSLVKEWWARREEVAEPPVCAVGGCCRVGPTQIGQLRTLIDRWRATRGWKNALRSCYELMLPSPPSRRPPPGDE